MIDKARRSRRFAAAGLTGTIACILSLTLAAALPPATADDAIAVYLVRHAEKATHPANDPALTVAGEARAATLARMLIDAGVTAVYASQFQRTQLTVQPLADQTGLDVMVLDAGDVPGNARHILDEHPGGIVVIAGHSNTVPDLVEALGGTAPGPIDDSVYDNLFVVILAKDGSATTLHLRYGE